ncbi:USP5_13 [Lepeophtheirus salmonis]|uniref:ubiquitinyl hydrolase 1 n=1 Tax=Lepeophtheirus salmonis TaxID=72036 RepID=A0A7R8CCX5_LEPSM|nr:USP5_13 [Lepeophtheirus salmonis]CAF2773667.1 USP5_13 [Lepeophtheirus salmonis]
MEILEKSLDKVRTPTPSDRIYKDECFFSFDTPESPGGLFICLNRFLGFGEDYVHDYIKKSGLSLFLRLRRTKSKKDKGPTATKVSRLAIGEPGGFTPDTLLEETNTVVLIKDGELHEFPATDPNLPLAIQMSVNGIVCGNSAFKQRELEREGNRWDGEVLNVSKFANDLKQCDSPVQLPHQGWKCEKCDLTCNLWLNLTSGATLCGRKNFDGSGGNNHAVEYYQETKYPLAVKLGTVTKDGKADVYSYPEDNMVLNPNLKEHLAHFGLKVELLDKTDKSMVEMEIDMNQRIGEWATLTESGSKLTPVFGPGFTGLQSLDFQLCRLTHGMISGKYSRKPAESNINELDADDSQPGIRPTIFKDIIGKSHPDFSGSQQQDAQMFFLHLLTVLERKSNLEFPGHCLQFEVEDRIECGATGRVKYINRIEDYLPFPIPMEASINQPDVDAYLARKEGRSCVKTFSTEEVVLDFHSSALNGESTFAKKTMRLKTFPDYLFIQMKKFDADPVTHQPYKLNVEVLMPDEIDLSCLKAKGGLQPGEVELEDSPSSRENKNTIVPDDAIVSQLASMGFSFEGCKKAVIYTKNSGVEAAMNWVMEHMEDSDFNEPMKEEGDGSASNEFVPSEESIATVMSMGFSATQAKHVLKKTDGNVERAVEWIFSHPDEMNEANNPAPSKKPLTDGPSKYSLQACISHMGTSHLVGHYVCHIRKDDSQWVIFNDNKVALSENPPKTLAYLYLYKRI